jgi:hypothetical protein
MGVDVTCKIPLRNQKRETVAYALVSPEDYEVVNSRRWYRTSHGYAATRVYSEDGRSTLMYMHRYLMDHPESEVDHVNRHKLDNRRENLRLATRKENVGNTRPPRGISGYRGVSASGNRWVACIYKNNKKVYLGCFASPEEAAERYDVEALEHFGEEFAPLNFPERVHV